MSDALRMVLVGCGGISGDHVGGLRELWQKGCREILFTACCDNLEDNARRRARELAEIQGVEPAGFTSVGALLKAKVADAADACLPHHLHHVLVRRTRVFSRVRRTKQNQRPRADRKDWPGLAAGLTERRPAESPGTNLGHSVLGEELLDGGLHLPYGASNSFGIEMWDFADAVLRGRRPEMDGEDGLRAQAPCMTCYESAASGKPVKYQDVPSGEVAAYQAPVDDHWKI